MVKVSVTSYIIRVFITAIECSSLSLANGGITYTADTTPEFEIGTVAMHMCDSGFALVGGMARTCVDDNQADNVGVWNGSAPTCEGKHFNVFVDFLIVCLKRVVGNC